VLHYKFDCREGEIMVRKRERGRKKERKKDKKETLHLR
jgi:hypothetical protein